MTTGPVYLVRHGQAGSRQKYDELSARGREQALLLGSYLRHQSLGFATVAAGGLERQQETARIVAAQLGLPSVDIEPAWSEFNLEEVFAGIAPQLAAQDPEFAASYQKLQLEMENQDSAIHREWTSCDVAVFGAWCAGTHPFTGETFAQFCARIRQAGEKLLELPKPALVVTSATPIGLTLGWAHGMHELAAMGFAGALYNSAWTEFDAGSKLTPVSFNNVPHLEREDLRTLR